MNNQDDYLQIFNFHREWLAMEDSLVTRAAKLGLKNLEEMAEQEEFDDYPPAVQTADGEIFEQNKLTVLHNRQAFENGNLDAIKPLAPYSDDWKFEETATGKAWLGIPTA